MVREGRVFINTAGKPAWGANFYVTAYEPGAQVSAGSSGTTVAVRAGHGFEAGDKGIVGKDSSRYFQVLSKTSTQLTLTSGVFVAADELLVNLGADTGVTSPNYDGSGATIYTDMDFADAATNSTVQANDVGRYIYWHKGIAIWELVRSSAVTPFALYTDTGQGAGEDPVSYGIRYAHLFATSGSGTEADPWVTSGSNPIQAAIDDLPSGGGDVVAIDGFFDLGSSDPAVEIPKTSARTDRRTYRIIGRGKDKTAFNYSGTGTAIRYWQNHTGTPGSSVQSNANALIGFALRQTGSDRTGVGIWLNYASRWTLDDLSIGTMIADRATTHTGFAYGIKFAERTSGYQTVDDFNSITNSYFSGNTHAFYSGQQADNLRFTGNYLEGNPNVSAAQDGVELHGTQGLDIHGNTFNFFGYDATMFALKLVGTINSSAVYGNYMEGNATAIRLDSQQRMNGIAISANFISIKNQSGGYGIHVGNTSGTYAVRALTIKGNQISGIFTGTVGIMLREDVEDAEVGPNGYESDSSQSLLTIVTGATTTGASVLVHEAIQPNVSSVGNVNAGATALPAQRVLHNQPDYPAFRAENTSSTSGNSPWFQGVSGGASHLAMSWYVDSSGNLIFVDTNGAVVASITQTGGLVTKGNSTIGDAATDTTTHVGRLIVRTIAADPTSSATAGTIGEVVYSSSTNKFYGKHTGTATDTNWRLLGT